MEKIPLKLFIVPGTARSTAALATAQQLLAPEMGHDRELIVVDVLQNPELAEDGNVLATPTLIKAFPPPERRAVGDLSNRDGLATVLGRSV